MKKYKDVLFSLGFMVAAPAWIFIWTQFARDTLLNSPSNFVTAVYIIPYFLFLIIGIFFGWKNLKSKQSPIIGNLITLIGVFGLLFSVFYYMWAMAWR